MSKRELLDKMKVELYEHIDEYRKFINTLETDPMEEMERYIQSGRYTTNLADLVIPMLTKVLNICIVVVQFDDEEQTYKVVNKDLHVFKPDREADETVYLEFSGDHYDTLIKSKDHPGIQIDDSYKPKRTVKLTKRMEASSAQILKDYRIPDNLETPKKI